MTAQAHEPAWLMAKADQRVAFIREHTPLELIKSTGVVVTALTEPEEGATAADIAYWDHACDNCGRIGPAMEYSFVERQLDGTPVSITFGWCGPCRGEEPVDAGTVAS